MIVCVLGFCGWFVCVCVGCCGDDDKIGVFLLFDVSML